MTNYKVGQRIVITEKLYGHSFDIGQVVKLTFYDISNNEWEAEDGNDYCYIRENEFSDAGILSSSLDKDLAEKDEVLIALEEQDRIVDYLSVTLAKELEKQKQMRLDAL